MASMAARGFSGLAEGRSLAITPRISTLTVMMPFMSNEGDDIRARRQRLEVEAIELAAAAGIHRNTLSALEKGSSYNASTLTKVRRALEAMEEEAGIAGPVLRDAAPTEPHIVVVKLRNDVGEVVIEGPIGDRE